MEENYLTPEEVKALLDRAMRELRMEWAIQHGRHEQRCWRHFWIGCIK